MNRYEVNFTDNIVKKTLTNSEPYVSCCFYAQGNSIAEREDIVYVTAVDELQAWVRAKKWREEKLGWV